ncbi:unnamed protein product [Rotaria socialis]
MEISSLNLNDLIFNGLVHSVELNGNDDVSTSEIKLLRIPTSKQLNDNIFRLLNCLFPIEQTDEMIQYQLKVSTNNLVSILSLQLAAPSRLDRHKLLAAVMQGEFAVLTKYVVKSSEKLKHIQSRSDDAVENNNLYYDQCVANFLSKHTPEIMNSVELKNHLFIDTRTDNQVYTIEQIIEPILKCAYSNFCKFNDENLISSLDVEATFNRLTRLLSCALFIMWSKTHGELVEDDLWTYWYRFITLTGLVCVLLDAYYRRATKKSGILHILSNKFAIASLSNVVVTIDTEQFNELLSEDTSLAHSYTGLHDNSQKIVDIEIFFVQAMQDISEALKAIIEEHTIAMLAEKKKAEMNSVNEHKKETISFINETQEQIKDNSITSKLYITKCALGFQINRDNDDSRYDSFARLTVLHVFELDIRDVAELISQQNEIDWPDKRINKSLIVNILRNTVNEDQKPKGTTSRQNVAQRIKKEWTTDDDMSSVTALEKFKIALVDLRRYFQYDDDLNKILECKPRANVIPNISALNSSDFPTFCNQKIWKLIQCSPEAKEALKIYHNHRGGWEIFDAFSVKLARLGFGRKGTGRIVAATDDRNTVRVLLHIGSHNTYMLYRSKAQAGVVAAYHGSDEKRHQPNLTFVDYLRLRPNVFNVSTRLVLN